MSFKRHRQKFHEKYKLITCQKWIHLELKLSRSARTFQSVNITLQHDMSLTLKDDACKRNLREENICNEGEVLVAQLSRSQAHQRSQKQRHAK